MLNKEIEKKEYEYTDKYTLLTRGKFIKDYEIWYKYNSDGELDYIKFIKNGVIFIYDSECKLTRYIDSHGNQYDFDDSGKSLVHVKFIKGDEVWYERDSDGRLIRIKSIRDGICRMYVT